MTFFEDNIKDAIKWAGETYKDNARISALLDDKAQKAAGLAGIFLAAAFGFVKTDDVNVFTLVYGNYSKPLLIGSLIFFIFCLVTCLSVMWVRKTPSPLGVPALQHMLLDLAALPEDELTTEVKGNFYREQLDLWLQVLNLQSALNRTKGSRLWLAQVLLGSGMILVAVLLAGVIIQKS